MPKRVPVGQLDFANNGPDKLATQLVDHDQWLQALADPACALLVSTRACGAHRAPRDWRDEKRSPNAHILHLVLDGVWQGGSDRDQLRSCGPGHVIWSMPGASFTSAWAAGYRYVNVAFSLRKAGRELRLVDDVIIIGDLFDLRSQFDQLASELRLPQAWHDEQIRALLLSLMVQICRRQHEQRGSALSRQHLQYLNELIESGLGGITAEQVATGLGISRDVCGRLFRRHFGMGTRQWLAQQRLAQASRLLTTTSLSIDQVADLLGYASANSFSRRFSKAMGLAPTRYRQRYQ